MIGIIGAMQVEIDTLIHSMISRQTMEFGKNIYTMGEIAGQKVVVVCSGIGKVNATIAATTLIHKFATTTIINIGVAGGVGENIKIGDIVLATSCVQFDVVVDSTNGGKIGLVDKLDSIYIDCDSRLVNKIKTSIEICGKPFRLGVVATSDKFITNPKILKDIKKLCDPEAVEMESGAIAQVCHLYKIPFTTIRTISDTADEKAEGDFATNMKATAQTSCNIITNYLSTLSIDF